MYIVQYAYGILEKTITKLFPTEGVESYLEHLDDTFAKMWFGGLIKF